jgi:hypothetical protein
MSKKIEKLSMKEFVDGGYLQEVNRRFFHILGLSIDVKQKNNKYEFSGIWDFRGVTGGVRFAKDIIESEDFINKTNKIKNEMKTASADRKAIYDEISQAVPKSIEDVK